MDYDPHPTDPRHQIRCSNVFRRRADGGLLEGVEMSEPSIYDPTKAEEDEMDRALLQAALDELKPLSWELEKDDPLKWQAAIVSAFQAICRCSGEVEQALKMKRGLDDKCCVLYVPIKEWILCTAVEIAGVGRESWFEAHPYSRAGHRILWLCKTMAALQFISEAETLTDNEDDLYISDKTPDRLMEIIKGRGFK